MWVATTVRALGSERVGRPLPPALDPFPLSHHAGEGELEDASQGLAFDADAPTLAFGALPGLWPVQVTASAVLAVLVGRPAPRPAWRPPVGSSIAVAAVVTAGDAVVLQTAGCRDLLVLRPGLGTGPSLVQEVRLPLEAEVSCLGAACAAPGGGLLLPFGTHAPSVGAVRFVPGELPALAWSAQLAEPLAALRGAGLAGDDDQRAPVESVALLPAAARGQAALCVLGTRAGLLLVLELGPGAGGALRPQSALRLGRGPVRLVPLPPEGAGGADPGPGALVLGAQAHVLRRGPGPVGRATLRALGVQGAALALPLAGGGFLAGMGDGRVARVTTLAGAPWRVESRLVEARALHDAGRRALVLGGWDPRTTGAALQALSPEAGGGWLPHGRRAGGTPIALPQVPGPYHPNLQGRSWPHGTALTRGRRSWRCATGPRASRPTRARRRGLLRSTGPGTSPEVEASLGA